MTISFVDAHRDRWSVKAMCTALEFSERTYYAAKRRPPSARAIGDEQHQIEIQRVWDANYRCYGSTSSCDARVIGSRAAR